MGYLRSPHHDAPTARIKRRHLAERGVRWLEQKVTGVSESGKPTLADGTVLDVATVIWFTGFVQHFEWINLPIFDELAGRGSTAESSTRHWASSSAA